MNRYWLFAIAVLIASAGSQLSAAEATSTPRDIGRDVLDVFSAKCAACHGPDVRKPKGRFGYVLDLKQLAADTEKVIPPSPEESELWGLVERNEMPPADAPHGALTQEQKDIIRAWIAAGAPEALPVDPKAPRSEPAAASVQSELTATPPRELSFVDRLLRLFGKFHLLLLHFPIALVVAAGVAEVLAFWQHKPSPPDSVRFCLWLAALAAIPAATAGWLFAAAGNGAGSPEILTAHRWLGTATAAWLAIAAILVERDARRGRRTNFARLWLLLGVVMTAITAHLGGLLARGSDFFNF